MRNPTPFETAAPTGRGYRDVTPASVAAIASARGNVRIVDVREPYEFNDELGHIAGAELVPLSSIGAHSRTWDREAELIVVCRSGGRSARAAEMLAAAGFRRVMNLAGGMLAYNAARLPVARN